MVGDEECNIRSPWNVVRLARLVRSWRPEVVQANLYPAEVVTTAVRFLAIGSGVRYVRRLANTEQCGSRSVWMVRRLARDFGLNIACSPPVAAAYRDFLGNPNNTPLVTISNAAHLLDKLPTDAEKAEARQWLGVPARAFVIGHIGGMLAGPGEGGGLASGQKAQDILLRAFRRAFHGDAQCGLLLVGDGPLRGKPEAVAENLGIAGGTHFLGQQPEPWPALRAADLFCFPWRSEGLPNVLPEAVGRFAKARERYNKRDFALFMQPNCAARAWYIVALSC